MTNAFDRAKKAQQNQSSGEDNSFKSGTAKKGGRPPKAAADKRESKVTVYFSSSELERIASYCEAIGVQPAVFLRTQAMNAIK